MKTSFAKRSAVFGVVNYGMGNIASIVNAFEKLGRKIKIITEPEHFIGVDGIVLPGVGSFGLAMKNLVQNGLDRALTIAVIEKKVPFLGICLGMQLVTESSEETKNVAGLEWFDTKVTKIIPTEDSPIPHVGWNEVFFNRECILFHGIKSGTHFYFDHSYEVNCDSKISMATTIFNKKKMIVTISSENIFAVQFHPEKSQVAGSKVLENYSLFCLGEI